MKLLKQWKGELDEASRQGALAEEATVRRDKAQVEGPNRKASEQFSQGKYSEAQTTVDRWLGDEPKNTQAREFQTKIKEVLWIKRVYEIHMNEKMYDHALDAVTQLEKINPEDPNFREMRAATTSRKLKAVAPLSILRLGEIATLSFHDRVLNTTAGEVVSLSIHPGRLRFVRGSFSCGMTPKKRPLLPNVLRHRNRQTRYSIGTTSGSLLSLVRQPL